MPLLKENVITAKKMSLQQISLLQENVTAQIVINTRKCHSSKMLLTQENVTATKWHYYKKISFTTT